ncbi:hypothetical protein [Pseudomonas sp. NPDC087336]|jgi:hypothetical protein|uniref:hypothetical protein n=1 Tax=Pseudomonas sp. NPDC087336 TaxID=3364436 RepID=UPI0038022115
MVSSGYGLRPPPAFGQYGSINIGKESFAARLLALAGKVEIEKAHFARFHLKGPVGHQPLLNSP